MILRFVRVIIALLGVHARSPNHGEAIVVAAITAAREWLAALPQLQRMREDRGCDVDANDGDAAVLQAVEQRIDQMFPLEQLVPLGQIQRRYHYEELATYAKRHGIHSADAILKYMNAVKAEFEHNFGSLEQRLGFKIRSVASHGDFANRLLWLPNTELLKDEALRLKLEIVAEAYDGTLMDFFDSYLSDDMPGRPYKGGSPFDAIITKRRVCLLTHPRHWRTAPLEDTADNFIRACEGINWHVSRMFSSLPISPVAHHW